MHNLIVITFQWNFHASSGGHTLLFGWCPPGPLWFSSGLGIRMHCRLTALLEHGSDMTDFRYENAGFSLEYDAACALFLKNVKILITPKLIRMIFYVEHVVNVEDRTFTSILLRHN